MTLQILLSIALSVALHALAFPPFEWTLAPWVALVPFLYWLPRLRLRRAAIAGLVWGTLAIWTVAIWVPPALLHYYQQPWWFGLLFCVTGSILDWGVFYLLFALGASWLGRRVAGLPRAVFLSALWVSCELARTRLLAEEPWMLLGYALAPSTLLIQAADLGGVYLLSFVVVLVNACLTEALLARPKTLRTWAAPLALAAAAVIAVAAYGRARLQAPPAEAPSVPIAVVQGNVEVGTQWRQEYYGMGLDRYLRLSYKALRRRRPAVLVWPEAAVTFFLADEPLYRQAIARVLAPAATDLLVGGPYHVETRDGSETFFNSAFYMASNGEIRGRYDKEHLLPFAEYFPLRFISFLKRRFDRVRSFTSGTEGRLLETRMGKTAVVICFEAIFPDLVRRRMAGGAEVLVNLSNDAWLGADAGAEQHLSMVVLRAVENRTWVVRATTTGISALIDPLGRIRQRSGTFEPATLEGSIVPLSVDTFYKRNGDVFAFASLALAVAGLAFAARRRPRSVPAGAGREEGARDRREPCD